MTAGRKFGHIVTNETREKIRIGHIGKRVSPKTEFKKGENKGEKNTKWKGNNVGYMALHKWVSRELGKPKKCEHCGGESKKKYEWANISHKYKREIFDWIRLCVPCHKLFDKK